MAHHSLLFQFYTIHLLISLAEGILASDEKKSSLPLLTGQTLDGREIVKAKKGDTNLKGIQKRKEEKQDKLLS
jgi:hypothetical protein